MFSQRPSLQVHWYRLIVQSITNSMSTGNSIIAREPQTEFHSTGYSRLYREAKDAGVVKRDADSGVEFQSSSYARAYKEAKDAGVVKK